MCRFSCQTRYSVPNSMDFVPFRQSKVYSKIGLKMAGRDKSCFPTYWYDERYWLKKEN